MNIKNIAEIIGGQIISRVEAKKETDVVLRTAKILVPKAITNGYIDHDNLAEINIKTELDEKKLTKAGDIVLKLSQPYDASFIRKEDENLLVTSFCLILRGISDEVNALYLLSVLNSSIYKEQALSLTSGATVPILTKGKVEKIDIDIVELEKQNEIVRFSEEISKKEKLFIKIIKLEKMKLENLLRGEY